ncbi:unnamed protein product [Paramecium sonneborni]|uniref:Uncharacterized protein n=1 Tax=Paramecium sonneborni TaxID=65129 RepID=A0A8S1QZ35_9CILI|nr:unnamed protein product [Paramecium sonneborni]
MNIVFIQLNQSEFVSIQANIFNDLPTNSSFLLLQQFTTKGYNSNRVVAVSGQLIVQPTQQYVQGGKKRLVALQSERN